MKYAILLGDGMPDRPIPSLGGKTPLQHAKTPNMDKMARDGTAGVIHTIPAGYPPGSDVGQLSVLGYDPAKYYTGRSPFEAASMGVKLGPADVAFRCNLVTLRPAPDGLYMADFSAGHITTAEAAEIIGTLQEKLGSAEFEFHPGVSYRHLLVWRGGKDKMKLVPPHDISDKNVKDYLPSGDGADELLTLMTNSQMVMKGHPVNAAREKAGKPPANSIWLWGHGKAPAIPTIKQRDNITGGMISAVDLMNGIGVLAGMEIIKVPGVTGYIDTNYEGKADYALSALDRHDLVYVHVEAPDEAAHAGSLENKIRALEDFDAKVVGRILAGMAEKYPEYRVMVLSDHPSPLEIKTHSSDPVPFAIYPRVGKNPGAPGGSFDEDILKTNTAYKFDPGWKLYSAFIKG